MRMSQSTSQNDSLSIRSPPLTLAMPAVVRDRGHRRRHVEAARIDERPGVVLHRDELGTGLDEQLGRRSADVAHALHRDARAVERQADPPRRLAAGDEDAATGRLDAAERAAEVQGLAGDDAGRGGAGVHRVRVHHPGHDLAVGVHVGRRDVALRADDDADLAGVAARHALELLLRELLRVAADAALGAAVRQVHRRALDRHPRRQRHHLLERHVGVVANAALARAARQVVLDAIALEVGDAAVVHLDRHVDDQRALGPLQRLRPARQRTRGRAGRGRPAAR